MNYNIRRTHWPVNLTLAEARALNDILTEPGVARYHNDVKALATAQAKIATAIDRLLGVTND